jgi:hypothetical protein
MINPLAIEKIEEGVLILCTINDYENFYIEAITEKWTEQKDKNLFGLWLSHNGFVKYNKEIFPGKHLFNFTKKGRLLRRLGSYAAYESHINQKIETEQFKRDYVKAQAQNMKWQAELIASQLKTNELSKITNVFIAAFTFIAAIYYGFEFCKDFINDCNPQKETIEICVTVFLGICGIWLLILVIRQWLKVNKTGYS